MAIDKNKEPLAKLKYKIDFKCGNFSKKEKRKKNERLADVLLLITMCKRRKKSFTLLFWSKDGSTNKKIKDDDLFLIWNILTNDLSDSLTLKKEKKLICKETVKLIGTLLEE